MNQFFADKSVTSEYARAQSILTTEQLGRLEQFNEVAKSLSKFQSATGVSTGANSIRSGRGTITSGIGIKSSGPVTARVGLRIMETLASLAGDFRYNLVGTYLTSPKWNTLGAKSAGTVSGFINNVGAKQAFLLMNQNPALKAELTPDE